MKFKYKKDEALFIKLKETLIDLVIDMAHWADENGCPFVITATISTQEEDIKLGRTSLSHREGRAVDISTNGWDDLQIKDFLNYYYRKFNQLGATSKIDGDKRLIVYGDKRHQNHFHIQIAKGLP